MKTIEKTFAIIKPDAVKAKNSGKIIDMIEKNGFEILAMQKINLNKAKSETFYEEHKARPFFQELVQFMTSGPIIIMALSKENAVNDWRNLMGVTDSRKAAPGTIRQLFGKDVGENAVHGSDSSNSAARELKIFFPELV